MGALAARSTLAVAVLLSTWVGWYAAGRWLSVAAWQFAPIPAAYLGLALGWGGPRSNARAFRAMWLAVFGAVVGDAVLFQTRMHRMIADVHANANAAGEKQLEGVLSQRGFPFPSPTKEPASPEGLLLNAEGSFVPHRSNAHAATVAAENSGMSFVTSFGARIYAESVLAGPTRWFFTMLISAFAAFQAAAHVPLRGFAGSKSE